MFAEREAIPRTPVENNGVSAGTDAAESGRPAKAEAAGSGEMPEKTESKASGSGTPENS